MNDDSLSDVTPAIGLDFGRTPAVVQFKPRLVTPEATPSDHTIVEMFERMLERAKAGDMKFAAVAWVNRLGVAYSTWEPDNGPTPEGITSNLGAIGYLHHRYAADAVAGQGEDPDAPNPN